MKKFQIEYMKIFSSKHQQQSNSLRFDQLNDSSFRKFYFF